MLKEMVDMCILKLQKYQWIMSVIVYYIINI